MKKIAELIRKGPLRDSNEFSGYEEFINQIGNRLPPDNGAHYIFEDLKREIEKNPSLINLHLQEAQLPRLKPYGAFEAIVIATLYAYLRLETEYEQAVEELFQLKALIETVYNPHNSEAHQRLIEKDKEDEALYKKSILQLQFGHSFSDVHAITGRYFLNSLLRYEYELMLSFGLAGALSITHFVNGDEALEKLEAVYFQLLTLPEALADELIPFLALAIEWHLSSEDRRELVNLGIDLEYEISLLTMYVKKMTERYPNVRNPHVKIAYDVALAYAGCAVFRLGENLENNQKEETDVSWVSQQIQKLAKAVFQDPWIIQLAAERIKQIKESANFIVRGPLFLTFFPNQVSHLRVLSVSFDRLFLDPLNHSDDRAKVIKVLTSEGSMSDLYQKFQVDLGKVIELSLEYQKRKSGTVPLDVTRLNWAL